VPGAATQPGSSGEVVIDSGLLIDSVLVYASYVWLCCGVLLFVLIPVVFLALYVWGSRRSKNATVSRGYDRR
jgi:Na+/H+ antiporter NhaC